MPRHPALDSSVLLRCTYVAIDRGRRHVIASVGEALRFLVQLPSHLDGLHWSIASTSLCWAHRQPDAGVPTATEAFENALLTDRLLLEVVPAA